MASASKLPANQDLSKEMIAYHQKVEDDIAANAAAVANTVTSIDGVTGPLTITYPLSRASQALGASLTSISAALGGDVALNNTGTYFDGPSIAQGTTGTWFVIGSVVVQDTAAGANINVKLWDGTTVLASGRAFTSSASGAETVTLTGIITNPVGNLRMSANDATSTSGLIKFNLTGNSKDSTITAVRIA